MKKLLLVAAIVVLTASMASAATTIVGSAHDLTTYFSGAGVTTQVCVFCHTPHQSTAAVGQDPLWNHSMISGGSYGVYASSTLNATPTDIAPQAEGSQSVSLLCMGCHDGAIAVNQLYKAPLDGTAGAPAFLGAGIFAGTTAQLGSTLSDDHPVNFTYDAALVTADTIGGVVGLRDPSTLTVPLYGGTVQCASCHNVHDPTNTPFLRMSNAASALCLACHIK